MSPVRSSLPFERARRTAKNKIPHESSICRTGTGDCLLTSDLGLHAIIEARAAELFSPFSINTSLHYTKELTNASAMALGASTLPNQHVVHDY